MTIFEVMSALSTPCLLNSSLNDGRVNFVFASPITVSFVMFFCLYKTMERYLLEITTGSSSPLSTTKQSRSFHIVLRAFWAILLLCNRKQNTTLSQMGLIKRPFSPVAQCSDSVGFASRKASQMKRNQHDSFQWSVPASFGKSEVDSGAPLQS